MLLIWQGLGFLVPVIVLVSFGLLAALSPSDMSNTPQYIYTIIGTIIFLVDAAIIWYIAKKLDEKPGRVVIDKKTGREFVLKGKHTFFFIPLKYWPYVIVGMNVVGVGIFFYKLFTGEY